MENQAFDKLIRDNKKQTKYMVIWGLYNIILLTITCAIGMIMTDTKMYKEMIFIPINYGLMLFIGLFIYYKKMNKLYR